MSVTYGAKRMRRATGSTRQVAILIKRLWSTFQERRGRQMARAALHDLSDRELEDIGTTRGEIDYVASQRTMTRRDRSTDGMLVFLLVCNLFILTPADRAKAQCTAQDVLRAHLAQKTAPPAAGPQIEIGSAADLPVWRTISIGTFRDSIALRGAMVAMGCGVGNSAAEVLARPAFTLSDQKTTVELLTVSAAELGLKGETASLREIYAHAQRFGFWTRTRRSRSAAQASVFGPANRRVSHHCDGADQDLGR